MDLIRNLFSIGTPAAPPTPVKKVPKLKTYPSPNTDKSLATVGYYFDFSQPPVGGRPVINNYNKYVYPAARINLQNNKFECRQPTWGPDCY
jgi:hypothetical protein